MVAPYQSDESVVNRYDIPVDNAGVNSNVGRFVTVEMIRQIINLKTIDDHATANAMFEQLGSLLYFEENDR